MSIFQKIVSFTVDYTDLDQFIAEKYGLDNFKGTIESSNDTTHEYTVGGSYRHDDPEDVQEILNQKWCEDWRLGAILDDMEAKGWIEPGNYLVRVSW